MSESVRNWSQLLPLLKLRWTAFMGTGRSPSLSFYFLIHQTRVNFFLNYWQSWKEPLSDTHGWFIFYSSSGEDKRLVSMNGKSWFTPNLPIPLLAPVTIAYFPERSCPWTTCKAVLLPSNFCLKSKGVFFSSSAKANLGSVYVVFLFMWLKHDTCTKHRS